MPSANLKPNADKAAGWDTAVPAGAHWSTVDEGVTTPDDADYIQTETIGSQDQLHFESAPGNVSLVTQVVANVRGQIDDAAATAVVNLKLYKTGDVQVGTIRALNGASFGGYGVLGNTTATWSGLSLTRAEADDLYVQYTFQAS